MTDDRVAWGCRKKGEANAIKRFFANSQNTQARKASSSESKYQPSVGSGVQRAGVDLSILGEGG